MADYDVIVIGAGCGGVTAGAILARQGRKVLLLEQSSQLGGCCSTFEKEGYHFDVGASIVEVPHLIDLAFQKLGTTLEQELDMIPCEPIYSVIFPNGRRVDIPESIDGTAEAIRQIAPDEVDGYYRFIDRFAEFIDRGGEDFFITPLIGGADMLGLMMRRPVIAAFLPFFIASYQDVVRRYFKDERVQQIMAYQSYYAGHSPDLAPGIFAVIPYSEHKGLFYPRGGMIKIPEAIARCGERAGMTIRFNTAVERIIVRNRRAVGVVLADGTEITASVIVSNINAKTLYLELIGEEHLPPLARYGIKSYEPALACPMVYIGVDYQPPLNAHHSIFTVPMAEMNDSYWNRYRKGLLPDRQFGLICWPTASDPSLAPKGHHVLNLILQGPYNLKGTDWDQIKEGFIEDVISYLSSYAIPDLDKHVQVAEMSSPLDFERRLRLPAGGIYGLQQDLTAQAVFRPKAKSRVIDGLYLTGASTHPGGGVPTTIGSGMNAVELINRYEP